MPRTPRRLLRLLGLSPVARGAGGLSPSTEHGPHGFRRIVYRPTLNGFKFGRLRPYRRVRENGITWYRCLCDCGKRMWVRYTSLQGKHARSCGCLKLETLHRRKKPDTIIRLNAMERYYKRNSKLREVAWRLSKATFQALVNQPCIYCGYHENLCGVDRVDNNRGYTIKNSVPCCRWCNWGKNERTLEEFKDWVRRLYAVLVHV